MTTFSTEEIAKIKGQARPPVARPYFYSAKQRFVSQITQDFEGFLILQAAEIKQKTLAWIKTANTLEEKNKARDELLAVYLDIRNTDAEERIAELDERTNEFNSFRENFITNGSDPSRFAAIEEVNLIVGSLQKPIDKIILQREQAFHETNLVALLTSRLDGEKTTADTIKELNSWQTVVSSYKGQQSS